MKKYLRFDIIAAILLFIFFLITYLVLLNAMKTGDAVNSLAMADTLVFLLNPITAALLVIFSFVLSLRYAAANRKKMSDYMKRIWGQILFMAVVFIIIILVWDMLSIFIKGMAERAENVFLRSFVFKLPVFAVYSLIMYNFVRQIGYLHASKKMYNMKFQIITVFYAFILLLPQTVFDSIYLHLGEQIAEHNSNPLNLFNPNLNLFDKNFSLPLVALTLFLSFSAEATVILFAYQRGKRNYVKRRIRLEGLVTDEAKGTFIE